jgi:predicted transcriptional regulator
MGYVVGIMNGQSNTHKHIYDIDASKVFSLMYSLFSDSVEVKILRYLSIKKSSCSLREAARFVDIHHTNLSKYMSSMVEKGILEYEQVGRAKVFRLSRDYEFLKQLFTCL